MQRPLKFRLRTDSRIVGYEKWYGGSHNEELGEQAKPCWLYSKDGEYWNPEYIYHRAKDEWTGLKDKSGKDVYEGDIVKAQGVTMQDFVGVVEYSTANANFLYAAIPGIEVIGNIYEHSELLKN